MDKSEIAELIKHEIRNNLTVCLTSSIYTGTLRVELVYDGIVISTDYVDSQKL